MAIKIKEMKPIIFRRSEKGQSFVELALSFTVILAILAGLINVSDIYLTYMTLRDAAQEGVNYAIYNPPSAYCSSTDWTIDPTCQVIISRVQTSSTFPLDLTKATVTINGSSLPACMGHGINVQVTYDYTLTAPFFGVVLGSQAFAISATSSGNYVTAQYPCLH